MAIPMARQLASAPRPSTPGVGAVSSPPALAGMSAASRQGPSSISQRRPSTSRALVATGEQPARGLERQRLDVALDDFADRPWICHAYLPGGLGQGEQLSISHLPTTDA